MATFWGKAVVAALIVGSTLCGLTDTAVAQPTAKPAVTAVAGDTVDCPTLEVILTTLSVSNDVNAVKSAADQWINLLEAAIPQVPADHIDEFLKLIAHVKDIRARIDSGDPSEALKEMHDLTIPLKAQLDAHCNH